MVKTNPSAPAGVSRLLELPGELRNRIYKAITDDKGPKTIRLYGPRPERSSNTESFSMDRHPGRQYLGLTQTNQMLRSEFLPLYMAVSRPVIGIDEVPSYLETFPLTDAALTATVIKVLRKVNNLKLGRTDPSIDLLPLLRVDPSLLNFSMTASEDPHANNVTHKFPCHLLMSPYHELALSKDSGEELITGIYVRLQSPDKDLLPKGVTFYGEHVALHLRARIDNGASDEEKIRIFKNFVDHLNNRYGRSFVFWCVSGSLGMVARSWMRSMVVGHLAGTEKETRTLFL